jgi:hypothetical protein
LKVFPIPEPPHEGIKMVRGANEITLDNKEENGRGKFVRNPERGTD